MLKFVMWTAEGSKAALQLPRSKERGNRIHLALPAGFVKSLPRRTKVIMDDYFERRIIAGLVSRYGIDDVPSELRREGVAGRRELLVEIIRSAAEEVPWKAKEDLESRPRADLE